METKRLRSDPPRFPSFACHIASLPPSRETSCWPPPSPYRCFPPAPRRAAPTARALPSISLSCYLVRSSNHDDLCVCTAPVSHARNTRDTTPTPTTSLPSRLTLLAKGKRSERARAGERQGESGRAGVQSHSLSADLRRTRYLQRYTHARARILGRTDPRTVAELPVHEFQRWVSAVSFRRASCAWRRGSPPVG